jgi:hypothetical protein
VGGEGLLDKIAVAQPAAGVVLANFLPQAFLGIVWGYLYMCTGNLWGPWAGPYADELDTQLPARQHRG